MPSDVVSTNIASGTCVDTLTALLFCFRGGGPNAEFSLGILTVRGCIAETWRISV